MCRMCIHVHTHVCTSMCRIKHMDVHTCVWHKYVQCWWIEQWERFSSLTHPNKPTQNKNHLQNNKKTPKLNQPTKPPPIKNQKNPKPTSQTNKQKRKRRKEKGSENLKTLIVPTLHRETETTMNYLVLRECIVNGRSERLIWKVLWIQWFREFFKIIFFPL